MQSNSVPHTKNRKPIQYFRLSCQSSEVKVKVQFSYMQATEANGEWSISPLVLNFDGTRWRSVISFTSRPLYLRGKNTPLPVSQSGLRRRRSGRLGEGKTLLSVPIIQPLLLHRPAPSLITVPTELCRLHTANVSILHRILLGGKMNGTRRASEEIRGLEL